MIPVVSASHVLVPWHVFGNVILLTPKKHADREFTAIEPAFNREAGLASGVSRLPYDAGLVFKVLGFEAAPVSAAIRAFWSLARQEVVGARVPDNFLWA